MSYSVTLPDSSTRDYSEPKSLDAIAQDIGSGLAKATVAGRIGGDLVDASEVVSQDCSVELITTSEPEALEVMRHSCAHLLGHALKQLIPEARMAIGPVIENGFYYDVETPEPLSDEFLPQLEERMRELAREDYEVVREVVERERAMQVFETRAEPYKQEIVRDIPDGEIIALYHHQEYIDMCRGPHVTNTRHIRHFKLTHLAGAYWRGEASGPVLTRIYGTAFFSKAELDAHLKYLEEAARRDHRRIGRAMGLFHLQDEAPGMVFWHGKGWTLYQICEQYMRARLKDAGYQEVHTPQLIDYSLWERSGHADKFGEGMFSLNNQHRDYAVKPMNCPGHVQLFNQGLRSYRELPLRFAEFGILHRNEPSGTLHGLLRVRKFTQDDGHIFCAMDQLQDEVERAIAFNFDVYSDFGFDSVEVMLSTRPEQRVGSDEVWDRAEKILEDALQNSALEWTVQPGEGAFYGPKIELALRDCLNRTWQCGTVQVDFSMPERLGAEYVAEDGSRQTPVMVHRAVLGSLERFIGVLLEHYDTGLPLWLAPVQAIVLNITDAHAEYARRVGEQLTAAGIRTEVDLRNEKIGRKIREHTLARIPYHLVVGEREMSENTVAVRLPGGEDYGAHPVSDVIALLRGIISGRGLLPEMSSVEDSSKLA
ncbi:MAG: threonine--tRNA ligase [Gammaproteobacteria bacterium AqS3]|nr:threonine--tRNA ligase [Gammaproteobacteria bacterium AqS3]